MPSHPLPIAADAPSGGARTAWALGAALTLLAAPVLAQPRLSLDEALRRADQHAYANRGARSQRDLQQASTLAPLRGILPAARVEAGYVRTTDPIGAFGTTLRQRTITQQDFDPARLNFPPAATNHLGGLVVEQPLFNADAWAGRRAAGAAARAADDAASWTQVSTRVDVIAAWFGAVLAAEKARALSIALTAAQGHVRQAESMQRNGMVTPSDAMLAAVKAGEVETMLLEARGDLTMARHGLATVMGTPGDTAFVLPDSLPAPLLLQQLGSEVLAARSGDRADVRAARHAADAASADAARARSLYLPRVNGFARTDWNSPQRPFGGDRNWTVGVMATWSPFSGAAELTESRLTAARVAAAQAMHDGARARAQLDESRTATELQVALARHVIAERAVRQATDAHRIVARKYAGGLAAVPELLDAATAETQARLGESAARYAIVTAAARRLHAIGADPVLLARLDTRPTSSSLDPSHP